MKQREFWISIIPDSNEGYIAEEHFEDSVHVREVSPEIDEAIQKMVEALEKYRGIKISLNSSIPGESYNGCFYADQALEAWKKANE